MRKLYLAILLVASVCATAQKTELVKYGDFDQWVVREIKESGIIGGKTTTIYAVGPTDTIRENKAFVYGKNGNPWTVSNAYAVVAGVKKGSCSVRPEKRGNGYCARMEVMLEKVKALGIINKTVIAGGSVFTGRTIEPITSTDDPYRNIDYGVPFTSRPTALMFDYKALISDDQTITSTKDNSVKTIPGHDECAAFLLLQKRWEDADGNIHALRVGTAYERFSKTQKEWVNGYTIPVKYGDITADKDYKSYMGLGKLMRAMNSKGKIVPIIEEGWAKPDEKPTHMILSFSCGIYEAFVGHEGNVFWVDNVKMVY